MLCIVEGNVLFGMLCVDVVCELGLFEVVVVVGGGGDNVMSVFGIGVIYVGDGFVLFGMFGVLSVVGDCFMLNFVLVVYVFCYVIFDCW